MDWKQILNSNYKFFFSFPWPTPNLVYVINVQANLSNGKERQVNWIFQTPDGIHLFIKHKWTPIVRHTLIRPDATPYDGNWTYWATRRGQAIDTWGYHCPWFGHNVCDVT